MPRSDIKSVVSRALVLRVLAARYLRLMRLHSPIGIWLLLWPTLWAMWIVSDGRPSSGLFAVFVLGTVVARSAGCVINDLVDRDIDVHVRRTAERPLARGEVEPGEAIALFVGLMLIALGLVMTTNSLTVLLAFAGAALMIAYPFMKRVIAAPQLVLGLAFAWGVPMVYSAELGAWPPRAAWLLFLCAAIWIVIYDTQYAMADREDDLKLGVKSTAILFGEMDVAIVGLLQAVLFIGLLLVGRDAELGLWFYLGLVAAACFAVRQHYLIRQRDAAGCFRAFLNNAWLGGAIFAGIALDYVLE